MAQEIYHKLEFNWWVKAVFKKRFRIISLVKKINSLYLKKTHKFGIEVPNSVVQAYVLDKRNLNAFWEDANSKEIKEVSSAFKKL